ncbi:hypothetical protein [Paenisporosarcina sp. OV554]|uniref:hypothetical protein n=1 Tax=Paenisporosarcina sp. OV554 TaxID=2135694 RepID=UPI000D3AB1D1|nr:hypothetical protein [Paenisporosarcina sp. OV554]PUB10140.1 hypothetical protein C8K15_12168 [Paenisporosarcina sp. OV554]
MSIKQHHGVTWYGAILNNSGEVYENIRTDNSELIQGYASTQVGLPKGTYYIQIIDEYNSEDIPYEIKAGFSESNYYEKEYNDNLTTANTMTLNQPYKGSLNDSSDKDIFKLSVPKDGDLTLSIMQQAGASWNGHIQNSAGTVYKDIYTNGDELVSGYATTHISLKKGTYYFVLSDYYSSEDKPYEFNISMKTPSLSTKQVKVSNNKGKDDIVTVTGISVGEIVKIYNASSKGSLLATKQATSSSVSLSIKQLGLKASKLYVTVTSSGLKESSRAAISFQGEQSNSLKASLVKVSNNKGKNDIVTVTGISKGDTVKIYNSSTKGSLLATKQTTSSSVSLSIKQLGLKASKIFVTVTSSGMTESARVAISFQGEKSNPLKASQVKVSNNKGKNDIVTITGISKGDTVKIFNSSTKGSLLATKQATSSSASLSIKQLGLKAGKIYVSITRSGMTESSRITASYSSEKK